MDVDKLSEDEARVILKRRRKRDRDRKYWRKHREKLNRKRRERYAREAVVLETIEEEAE